MATTPTLVSTGLMALAAVLVGFALVRSRHWERYVPAGESEGPSLAALASSQTTWMVLFLVLVLGAVGASVAVLGGSGPGTLLIGGLFGALLLGFLVVGIYATGRSRGHPHSHAVAETVGVLGFLFIAAVAGQVVLS